MAFQKGSLYTNPSAREYQYPASPPSDLAQVFHNRLPGFEPSALVPLTELAKSLNVRAIYVKDESSRLGLPAFKILGASWGVFRAITKEANLPLDSDLSTVASAAQNLGLVLFAATDGNHGRAVARMASLLAIPARIFVPRFSDQETKDKIASEGAQVTTVPGDYDQAIQAAISESLGTPGGRLIQDNAWETYEEIPQWIIQGYTTLLLEIDQQLFSSQNHLKPTVIVTPIGVGSLGHAVIAHSKSQNRNISVLTVEPVSAACLNTSLHAGRSIPIKTSTTIMDGMNCGTLSSISWPVLQRGVDASVTVTEYECHTAVQYLQSRGINAGPCGAAALAALKMVAENNPGAVGLNQDSVVVLLSTEGKREYPVP